MGSVHFSICYLFYVWIAKNWQYFFEIWWIINGQIFSLKHFACWFLYHWDLFCMVLTNCTWNVCMHLFMGHIVSNLHILKERIFVFKCILSLIFKFGLYLFSFPHLLNFSQNLFCFSYFYRRRKLFFKTNAIGGVALLILYFLLLCTVYLFIGLSLSIRDKKGEK